MSITIQLSPDKEARVRAEAARRNQPTEEYLSSLLESLLPDVELSRLTTRVSKEERLRIFHEWIESHRDMNLPILPEATYERASFYREDEGW